MPQDGEINLKEVKAKYSVKDIEFIDSRELDFANEFRLSFEISFAIGLTVLGATITNFNWILLAVTVIFLAYGFFNLFRYGKKYKEIRIGK
jgi:hypothetical protein